MGLLPTTTKGGSPRREGGSTLRALPKRYFGRRGIIAVCLLFGIYWFFGPSGNRNTDHTRYPEVELRTHRLPPLFPAYREYEDHVSRTNIENRPKNDKFIFFANHAAGCGWGNVLQNMVFSSLVASGAKRGFVWVDYTWERETDYSTFNGKKIPSKIPISTMLSGYMVGLPPRGEPTYNNTGDVPPSISWRVYNKVCPKEERVIIDREMVKQHALDIGITKDFNALDESSGKTILNAWLKYLDQPQYRHAKCIEVKFLTYPPFDIWLMGSAPRMLDLWDYLANAPVMKQWGWSKLIHDSFKKNIQLFVSPKNLLAAEAAASPLSRNQGVHHDEDLVPSVSTAANITVSGTTLSAAALEPVLSSDTSPLPIIALHIRRGDFEEHCTKNLVEWGSSYNGMNSFPEFAARDAFIVPKVVEHPRKDGGGAEVASKEEKKNVYVLHCYPDIPLIVKRVRDVVRDYQRFVTEESLSSKDVGHEIESTDARTLGNRRLNKVYIMTNGDRAWLGDLKKAILEDAERSQSAIDEDWEFEWAWEDVGTSRDLVLGWEEKPVAQALDMFVAQRAELFVGNGFSSLTSNIVMLRKRNGFDPVQTRFW